MVCFVIILVASLGLVGFALATAVGAPWYVASIAALLLGGMAVEGIFNQ